jgi:hypothetical protein
VVLLEALPLVVDYVDGEPRALLVDALEKLAAKELGRDSPIVKRYSSIKNSCFVTCVNSALCCSSSTLRSDS